MLKVAYVIVDVPTMQTDQPFTYEVPSSLAKVIEVGMRVEVPFGLGNRHLQGFVVALGEMAEAEMTLKPIIRLIDIRSVLNAEQLALADYMKNTTYSFKITCLQTMLPAVMKAAYQKSIIPLSKEPEVLQYFGDEKEIFWEVAEAAGTLPQLLALRKQEKVDIRYHVKEKNRVKTRRYVEALLNEAAYEEIAGSLGKTAHKQRALLVSLSQQQQPQTVAWYKENGFSLSQLNHGRDQGWLQFIEVEEYRDPYAHHEFATTQHLQLNDQQAQALQAILAGKEAADSQVFLLEGITGSGKTEVYLQAISEVLVQGETAMMLVPEISLTPQMVERFKGRFGEQVAVLHSGLSQGEKYDEWRKIERNEAQVVVGARSAVFAPLNNLGIIIIDEEHEATYKQDETPRYHARDLAIWRGRYHHCPVVLGSATPSLESRARAQKNVYHLLRLTQRGNQQASLPEVTIVDMRDEFRQKNHSSFSQVLLQNLTERIEKQEQSVLMLNRRGYSSFVMCRDCGFVLPCPNCDISLTLHMDTKTMRCHYCGHEEGIPHRCPNCGEDKIRYYGTGTQKVEEELQALLPAARILRMDVDTTRKKGAHEKLLQAFGNKEADILLGTQMIAKGLDFPNVTLVGVLNADTSLNLPDFRASERTFQLLTQVSGRAGRGEKKGEVFIQTFNPEHYSIRLAQTQDYEAFYQREMQIRHHGGYPPYYYTVKITASHPEENVAAKKIFQVAKLLKAELKDTCIVLGPSPSAILRVKNRYYYQMIIKYKQADQVQQILTQILEESQADQRKGLYLTIDNEPLSFI
ncbi:primosomal protein N' (replication factor Y) [Enterococcus sp. PF1-24]|uniref:primosomal protein N' n=1 Tax=unclassified Enterococcus TaxID=2608891 RepID=UPI002475CCB2|nr:MULTISPECIES: primosomal protein N' [unclassified Enterococcus]MDH6364291.1 primosomal protein N' (replication factor Y) [Enterococcus sp. PFB1-1]MDH6401350.1 primosomal protein N' (replication factor Y) [Enterococcus sp. PF1-24]